MATRNPGQTGQHGRFIHWGLFIVAGVAMAACWPTPPVSTPPLEFTVTPTPEITATATPWATVVTTPVATATATPEAGSVTPAPTITRIPPTPTAAVTPNLADTLPPGFVPHAALHRVAPPIEHSRSNSAFQWDNDEHLRYRVNDTNFPRTGCVAETWAIYTVFDATQWVSETLCTPEVRRDMPDLTAYAEFAAADIEDRRLSPDGTQAFVLTKAMTTTLPPLPKIGTYEPELGTPIRQGWFVDLIGGKVRPAFYTTEIFDYVWSADGAYLAIFGGTCYGGYPPDAVLGLGLYGIAVKTLAVYTINPEYVGGCEGGVDLNFSPDGRHVIYPPGVVSSLDGKTPVRVCAEDEYSRSYTWTEDGRYVYVACGKESDTLRRYDAKTGDTLAVVDREEVFFRAIRIRISPNQNYMAFLWSTSTFVVPSPHDDGIWILDLTTFAR
ncbi:MAG: hypothetical protein JXA21_20110 [Anaerolineae bacterium]|nr:hypothetical protein [Anaerolineae bacterium]